MADILGHGSVQMSIGSKDKDVTEQKIEEHCVPGNNGGHLFHRNGGGGSLGLQLVFEA
ncbi:hypothetical protein D3C75_1185340 [compost metagenome]